MPFSLKFVIPLLLLILLLMQSLVVAYFSLSEFDKNIQRESVTNLNQQMQHLQSTIDHLAKLGEVERIQQLIAALGSDLKTEIAVLVDEKGLIIASYRLKERGESINKVLLHNTLEKDLIKKLKQRMQGNVQLSKDTNCIIGIYPIVLGTSQGHIRPNRIGMLIIEKDITSLKANSRMYMSDKLFPVIGIIFILVLFMWLLLHYGLTKRIMLLVELSKDYSRGLYHKKLPIGGNDEITTLSKASYDMASQIAHSHEELENKVQERTLELVQANTKLKELDKLKSMFIASMSHELRTPLNSIIGFTDVILNRMIGDINEQQEDYLSRVKRSGKHLLRVITDVIDISKIEAGKVSITITEFELTQMIDEAVKEAQVLVKSKPINILVEMPNTVNLHTDRRLLLQCLINFLSNAIKFSEEGDITVSVNLLQNKKVIIKVCDQGIGIRDKDKELIFEAFERAESHLKVIAGGSGLGLYLTKKITEELLKGSVNFTSEYGKGSCFWIEIPTEI